MKQCNGCLNKCTDYRHYAAYPKDLLSRVVISSTCPCGTCLVKMICEDKCDEFYSYLMDTIRDMRNNDVYEEQRKVGDTY